MSAVAGLARLGIVGLIAAGVIVVVKFVIDNRQRESPYGESSSRSESNTNTESNPNLRQRKKRNDPYVLNVSKTCVVCQDDFVEDDSLPIGERRAILPECGHQLHYSCIDALKRNRMYHCPLCGTYFGN